MSNLVLLPGSIPLIPLQIDSASPEKLSRYGGTPFTIYGQGFHPDVQVKIDGQYATDIEVTGHTVINGVAKTGYGYNQAAVVENPNGDTATLYFFDFEYPPIVNSLTPSLGDVAGGNTVRIYGDYFAQDSEVFVGGYPVETTFISSRYLDIVMPPFSPGVADVRVTGNYGLETTKEDAYTYGITPNLTSVSEDFGNASGGETITLYGTDFIEGATVDFSGTQAQNVVFVSSSELRVTSPSRSAGQVDITVTNPSGLKSTLADSFTFEYAPTVSSVEPNIIFNGQSTNIVIRGSYFDTDAQVYINNSLVTVEASSSSYLRTVPISPSGSLTVRVVNPSGMEASYTANVTYMDPVATREVSRTQVIPEDFSDPGLANIATSSDGATVFVGRTLDDGAGEQAGAVFVYTRSGDNLSYRQKIYAPDAKAYTGFGNSVACSADGSRLLIGANTSGRASPDGDYDGALYVYKKSGSTWVYAQKVTAPDPDRHDFFGEGAISGNGNIAMVGAPRHDHYNNGHVGSVYAYTVNGSVNLQYAQEIKRPDRYIYGVFGNSVALDYDGNTAIIGDPESFNNGTSNDMPGKAHIYTRSGSSWGAYQVLTGSGRANGDGFGESVDISDDGTTAIVGAPTKGTSGRGHAYLFKKINGTWVEEANLAGNYSEGGLFGRAVSLSRDGNVAFIGARGYNYDTGEAHVYVRTNDGTWEKVSTLRASNSARWMNFGKGVSANTNGSLAVLMDRFSLFVYRT